MNWATYHNYTNLASLISAFSTSYPNLVDAFIIGRTWEGRDIFCIRMTDESVTNSSKQQILIIAEHHAREVITQEAALYMIWYLLTNYETNTNIKELFFSKEIYVIPCLNPDGMEAALTYNPFQRKNMRPVDDDNDSLYDEDIVTDLNHNGQLECYEVDRNLGTYSNPVWVISDMAYEGSATQGDAVRTGFISDNPGGVDLNRNYGFHFNDTFEMSSNSTNPRVEDYKGPAPFSEPETRAVKELVESHRFIFAMTLHSGAETLLRPWSYTTGTSSLGANLTLFNMFGEAFEQSSGIPYRIGTGNIGYNISGDFTDWTYGKEKILAMGCEIYGEPSAYEYYSVSPSGDRYVWWGVWDYFNPPGYMIEPVCTKTLGFLLQVSSINNYSSLRISSAIERSMTLSDGSNTLELNWILAGVQDIALGSHTFLPFEIRTRNTVKPLSNVFLVFSDRPVHDMELSLSYSDQQLNATYTDEKDIAVLMWDAQYYQWITLEPIEKDIDRNRITVILGTNMASNTPYYFMLGSLTPSGLQTAAILISVVILGGAVASFASTVLVLRRRREESDSRQSGETS